MFWSLTSLTPLIVCCFCCGDPIVSPDRLRGLRLEDCVEQSVADGEWIDKNKVKRSVEWLIKFSDDDDDIGVIGPTELVVREDSVVCDVEEDEDEEEEVEEEGLSILKREQKEGKKNKLKENI